MGRGIRDPVMHYLVFRVVTALKDKIDIPLESIIVPKILFKYFFIKIFDKTQLIKKMGSSSRQ